MLHIKNHQSGKVFYDVYLKESHAQSMSAEREQSGKRSKRVENRLEQSRAARGVQKIKWSVMSGAGAGGRRNGNGAVSGQNLPLKIRSAIKPLKVKSSKIDFKSHHELSV